MNWWGNQGVGSFVFLLENIPSLSLLYIHSFICHSVGQRIRTGKINLFVV